MKKILVACGGAIATSTVAAQKIRELLAEEGIKADVSQCRISELQSNLTGTDLIVTTAKVTREYGVPLIHGVAFITGINLDVTKNKILEVLK